ncbi:MAG: imidazolonepropionase [Planctomycetes bacterium]|nr:imidazolonepropionase [Planctomycetota bacterium]
MSDARKPIDLLLRGAAQVASPAWDSNLPLQGARMSELVTVSDGSVAVHAGRIVKVGPAAELDREFHAETVVDASGCTVTPGLVDPHTHALFVGSRDEEFEARIRGRSYAEIAAAGGGIQSSVRAFRAASPEELSRALDRHLHTFLEHGTTTVEVKTGYGLDYRHELGGLEVLAGRRRKGPPWVIPTFLGAHAIPAEFAQQRTAYLRLVIETMIPEAAEEAEFCDCFCENGAFDVAEARQVLLAGKAAGLRPKLHAEEFSCLGGAELAAEVGAVSADHLMAVSDRGIAAMRDAGVVAVLLPSTTLFLGLNSYAPARRMIDAGVAVALGTDFNPGTSMTPSLPLVMTLACTMLRMTPAEALVAATRNAACALGRGDRIGDLAPGRHADLVVWSVPNYRFLAYHFGVNHVREVVCAGKVAYRRPG